MNKKITKKESAIIAETIVAGCAVVSASKQLHKRMKTRQLLEIHWSNKFLTNKQINRES